MTTHARSGATPTGDVFQDLSTDPGRRFPCSLAQQGFWVLDRLSPGDSALNIAVRWRLEGKVATADLEQAFRQILSRHDLLRTRFDTEDGELVQIVEPAVPFHLPVIDLSALPESTALAEAERHAQLEARGSFDLSSPPLIRVTQLRVRADLSVLLVTLHHIVGDGWSMGLIAHEMGEICAALHEGRRPNLPPLPLAYGEYARRQREWLASPDFEREVDFWRRSLEGVKHFELPTDLPRPAEQTSNSTIVSNLLPRALTNDFAQFARRNGCTLYMAALATLLTLLHRYSGEPDIALGTQVVGRDDVDIENVIGLFINTLVLRGDLSGDPPFAEVLERIQDLVGDAFEHQHLPHEKLTEIVAAKRDLSRNALFSVNFIFQRSFIRNETYGSFKLVDLPSRSAGALYDLNFFMVERPEGWRFSCEYNTDLFEEATVLRMISHFQSLMKAVIAEPQSRLSALPVLAEPERHQLLVEWNETAAPLPERCVHELFVEQATRTPDAVAAAFGDAQLSYAELDARSNQLAHHLQGLGVGPEVMVAICMERSLDMVVGLLGIVKAGGAYVPLDPDYPAERLTFMLDDTAAPVLLTQERLLPQLPAHQAQCVCVDRDRPAIVGQPSSPVESGAGPRNLAYVMYTSGSTGTPKGVCIEHRNIVRLVGSFPWVEPTDAFLQLSPISFDASTFEIWVPLSKGARLAVYPPGKPELGEIRTTLSRYGITVLWLTAALFDLAVLEILDGLRGLRALLAGGDVLTPAHVRRALAALPGTSLINGYGPTETTTFATLFRVISAGDASVPIGRPISNTRLYVLDRHGEPVPIGVAGELHIGGAGVARGYLHRPALTAERFLDSPFVPGDRLYRTGDLVRYLSDGNLAFLGRLDRQVKIRGFRIELGEIEAALREQPGVREAVVLAREDVPGDKRLVAYLVAPSVGFDTGALRATLQARLPDYMVPSAIVRLEALPMTPSGKLDRGALPPPSSLEPLGAETRQELDGIERRLADIWGAVLGLSDIRKDADFFQLGGHSLLAARLLMRIEAEFGRKINLAAIFKARTLEAMAHLLRRADERQHDFRQVVHPRPRGNGLPIIAINNTGIYFDLADRLGADRSFTALQLFDPSVPREQMPETLGAIIQQYIALIREVQPSGPYALLGWCVGGSLAFEIAQQLTAAGQEISLLALIDTWAPGYMKNLPPFQGKLADYSYRWQLIAQDWSRAAASPGGLAQFLRNRTLYRRLAAWFTRHPEPDPAADGQSRYATADTYDQWLSGYLVQVMSGYRPQLYQGKITIFRSETEPHGRFLDGKFGWQAFSTQEVEVVTLPGDHFSVFEEPGVDCLARHVGTRLNAFAAKAMHPEGQVA